LIDERARPPYLRIRVGEDEPERFDRVALQREAEVGDGSDRRRAPAALREGRGVGRDGEEVVEKGVRPPLPAVIDGHRHGGGGGGRDCRAPAKVAAVSSAVSTSRIPEQRGRGGGWVGISWTTRTGPVAVRPETLTRSRPCGHTGGSA
jgi:hypothetical protein